MVFEDLRAFVAVARCGSFAGAAAELCIAQSALSKRVQRLEHRMGTALFERRARGVTLTVAGNDFLVRAQRLVDEVADMERNLSTLVQTPSGEVRIALPQRTCGILAPPVIERCERELPLVSLHVLEGTPSNVHGWLMRSEADIALTYNPELGVGFEVKPFLIEPLFLYVCAAAAPRLFGGDAPAACSLAVLGSLPLILPRRPNVVRLLVDRLCVGHGIRPQVRYEMDGTATIRGLVERGMGATVFSLSSSWSYGVETGQLLAIPFTTPLMNWKLYLARSRRDSGAIAVGRVFELVEQEVEVLLESGAWPNARRIGDEAGGKVEAKEVV